MINHMLAQWFVAFPLATKVQVEGCVFLGEKSADVSIFLWVSGVSDVLLGTGTSCNFAVIVNTAPITSVMSRNMTP